MWNDNPHSVERGTFIGVGTFGADAGENLGTSLRHRNKEHS